MAARSRSLLHTAYLLTGDWEQGRDLLQTVLASTARRWSKLRDREQPEIYVRRALYNAQVNRFRLLSWGWETVTDTVPDRPSGQAADWADTVVQRQDIVAALRRLPKRQRAVIVLRYFEDRPDNEIAAILGVAQGTVRSQTHKALASLRTTLAEAGPSASSSTASGTGVIA